MNAKDGSGRGWRGGLPMLALAVVSGLLMVGYAAIELHSPATAGNEVSSPEITASLSAIASSHADSTRLKLPRFVSLKADRVNVRRGPSSDHAIAWIYHRKSLPVEIIAEFQHWRRVRDSDGEEGWVYQSLLSGRRTAIVAPWIKGKTVPMLHDPRTQASVVALVGPGVIGDVETCSGHWCQLNVRGHEGWIRQALLWGVYPGEHINN